MLEKKCFLIPPKSQDFIHLIQDELETVLHEYFKKKYLGLEIPPSLQEAMQYSVCSPGKRIRPRLFLSTAKMLGLDFTPLLPVALALEVLHAFTLVHDDLPCMDNADFRRGLPTTHRQFGEAMGVLSGDALIVLGFEIFLKAEISPNLLLKGLQRLMTSIGPRGVLGGQVSEGKLHSGSQWPDLQNVYRQKTGILFTAAILMAKDFAEIPDDSSAGKVLSTFAEGLGLAFQIADDLEDSVESENFSQPSHALFYQERKPLLEKTILQLQNLSQNLLAQWPENGVLLANFAQEVIDKLQRTESC